jgi:hypothetical protein
MNLGILKELELELAAEEVAVQYPLTPVPSPI